MASNPKIDAVPLRDDQLGVSTEKRTRNIQARNGDTPGYRVSINPNWLNQLNLAAQGEPTVQSLSLGHQPVIVQHPAIIVQPATVLDHD